MPMPAMKLFFERNTKKRKKKKHFSKKKQKWKKKDEKREGGVILKWATPNRTPPVHRGPKTKVSQKEIAREVHDHSSHTRPKQIPGSRRHSHRHKNRKTNCHGLLATTPRSVEQLQTLRLAHAGPFLLLRVRRAEDAGKRAALRWSTLSAAWSRINVLTFAARVPSSSACRTP